MTAVLWLAGAILLAELSRHRAACAGAVLLACLSGTTLPDLDLSLGLVHRSILTHGPLLPALLLLGPPRWRPAAAGLALGIGLHVAADTFPNAMTGYATVKLPLAGSIGATASYLWLAANALALTIAGGMLLAREFPPKWLAGLLAGSAAIGIAYLFVTDGGWPALGIYAAFGWLAVRQRKQARIG
ncbi:hypothetical protein [Sphingomonas sp. ACRSK]|uniref:hypothetical protein n=1 Tax=Sphingomonas sp. ACRSK TaxID=2918213 RepID=UPI001EF4B76E|nr:hypothetical protein [Sphingomonas sp. ACRSK]MCG7349185.1 hypothetical protein [Sphingomonas sp. ACRSK]